MEHDFVSDLAKDMSFETALAIVAQVAINNASDFLTDMIMDTDYVKDNGLPDKNDLITQSMLFATEILPDLMLDQNKPVPPQNPGEHNLVHMLRCAIMKRLKDDSSNCVFEFTAR